ncbi:MAG: hypothetical protein HWD59_11575 [Coxiellaceae bacterium]|nr:MAG: hypothetical protein HWD59_11575 [Coxiellaceae bacterium]
MTVDTLSASLKLSRISAITIVLQILALLILGWSVSISKLTIEPSTPLMLFLSFTLMQAIIFIISGYRTEIKYPGQLTHLTLHKLISNNIIALIVINVVCFMLMVLLLHIDEFLGLEFFMIIYIIALLMMAAIGYGVIYLSLWLGRRIAQRRLVVT